MKNTLLAAKQAKKTPEPLKGNQALSMVS